MEKLKPKIKFQIITQPLKIKQPGDVVVLLEDTINKVRKLEPDGTMDTKTANCIGYLSGQIIKAIEVAELSERVEMIEKVLLSRSREF